MDPNLTIGNAGGGGGVVEKAPRVRVKIRPFASFSSMNPERNLDSVHSGCRIGSPVFGGWGEKVGLQRDSQKPDAFSAPGAEAQDNPVPNPPFQRGVLFPRT